MFSQSLIPIYSLRFMSCYFMIVNAIAIYIYPCGSLYNYDLTSYSFTENFFSDLGVYKTTGNLLKKFGAIVVEQVANDYILDW